MITKYIRCIYLIFASLSIVACTAKPDFYYADGKAGNYTDFNRQWLVINYWANWCKPCIEEIPELNKLHALSSENATARLKVIGIAFDKPIAAQLLQQRKQLGIEFAIIDQAPTTATTGIEIHQVYDYPYPSVLPTTVLINPRGRVHKVLTGPQTATTIQAVIDASNALESVVYNQP